MPALVLFIASLVAKDRLRGQHFHSHGLQNSQNRRESHAFDLQDNQNYFFYVYISMLYTIYRDYIA
jgi:hypothetical protein